MSGVIAGVQAGVTTLVFILMVVVGYAPSGATAGGFPVWAIYALLVAGLCAMSVYVLSGSGSITIAVTTILVGLMGAGIYFTTRALYPDHVGEIMTISLAMGLALGISWAIAIAYSSPAKQGVGI